MAAIIEVNYFNSFWLKKVVDNGTIYPSVNPLRMPVYPGSNPAGYNLFNNNPSWPGPADASALGAGPYNWYIEESRIRGGYNNTSVDLGVKAYIEEDAPSSDSKIRQATIIYSGLFNSKTGVNETNQFSTATPNTKSLDPLNGSLQRMYAEDTNLICFQERKVSRALIDKDAIYSAEGNPTVTTTQQVIGEFVPYVGEYGISNNPESFARFGFRKYFVDKDRGVVLRLSRDGITEISAYGLSDYFRDRLKEIPNTNTAITINTTNNDVSGTPTVTTTFGVDMSIANDIIELGMLISIDGVEQPTTTYVTDIQPGTAGADFDITVSEPVKLNNAAAPTPDKISFKNIIPTRIVGGWDIHNRTYTVSLQDTSGYFPLPSINYDGEKTITYSTLCFDDQINGWVSYYTYKPDFMVSLKNSFYTCHGGAVYIHYANIAKNYGVFYNDPKESNITFVFNDQPSIVKNFQTISYEGDNGWEVDYFKSGFRQYDDVLVTGNVIVPNKSYQDETAQIKSLQEGIYYENGEKFHAGFYRKENRYVANLIDNSVIKPEEVITGAELVVDPVTGLLGPLAGINSNKSTGIKGYFSTVKISTDGDTDPQGPKELFSVGSKYVVSS